MSDAETTLGAAVFVNATRDGIDRLVKSGTPEVDAWRFSNLRARLRDAGTFLYGRGVVTRDDQGAWQVDDAALSALPEADHDAFQPVWRNLVAAHVGADPFLRAAGKTDYIDTFNSAFNDTTEFEITAPSGRITDESAQKVATAGLDLLGTIHGVRMLDPARFEGEGGTFVLGNGLSADDVDALWGILSDSDYVMPGDNPDRARPIADQTLRGTPEQIDALYTQALSMAAKIPEGAPWDSPVARPAANLRKAALTAELDAPEMRSVPAALDTEMPPEADAIVHEVYATALALGDQAFYSGPGDLRVSQPAMAAFQESLEAFRDAHIDDAFARPDFEATALTPEDRKAMLALVEVGESMHPDRLAEMAYSGDDAGEMTQEGAYTDLDTPEGDIAESGADPDQRDVDGARGEGAFASETARMGIETHAREMGTDRYGTADPTLTVPAASLDQVERIASDIATSGKLEKIRANAGLEAAPAVASAGQAAYADINEAFGADRMAAPVEVRGRAASAMSRQSFESMSAKAQGRIRCVKVTPELMARHAAPGNRVPYRPGPNAAGAKRVRAFIDANMSYTDAQGAHKPNTAMRKLLADMNDFAVVAGSYQEALSLKQAGHDHVARARKEAEAWKQRTWEKKGVRSYELPTAEAQRQVRILEAAGAGPDAALRMTMSPNGEAMISHPDGGRIMAASESSGAQPNSIVRGNLPLDTLKTAAAAGTESIRIMVSGETPIGAVGKRPAEEEARNAAKARDAESKAQVVLS